MGDRVTTILPCPKCGKESEQYDQSSALLWFWDCEHCGWRDDRNYHEDIGNQIVLCTEEEARERGLLIPCPRCKKECGKLDVAEFKMCHSCYLK